MAQDIEAEITKKNLCQSTARDPRSGLACAGSFQNVPGIGMVVFQGTCKVGMTRTRPRHAALGGGIVKNLPSRHDFFPVRPVTVFDHHRDRAADGLSMPHTREETNLIFFDFHPSAAAVSAL